MASIRGNQSSKAGGGGRPYAKSLGEPPRNRSVVSRGQRANGSSYSSKRGQASPVRRPASGRQSNPPGKYTGSGRSGRGT